MNRALLTLALIFACFTIKAQQPADLILYNGTIYKVDHQFSTCSAVAIRNHKIIATGTSEEITKNFISASKIDLKGKFAYPGFIDAHAHFYRYGLGLQTVDLFGIHTWEQTVEKVKQFSNDHQDGWLLGRGWDQNLWPNKDFPDRTLLDQLFPDRPVVLTRVDGHAVIANGKALQLAGIRSGISVKGGKIEEKNGKLTGVLIDNATDLVYRYVPEPTIKQATESLMQGQQNCFEVGLTTVDDCGLDYPTVLFIDSLQKKGELKMRVYAMLSDRKENYNFLFKRGRIKTDQLNVRSFKVYADGALGSRGACLLAPYSDKPDWSGFLLSDQKHFDSVARIIYQHGFQMCTHAIGDSGNRTMLKIYAKYLKKANDLRWRIEHAQVINPQDFYLFKNYNIVPSVQPTHATSDMKWAIDRLGKERLKGAYAYKDLLNQNQWIPLGTDFPVEDISPLKTFYAAVVRKDLSGYPDGGFQMENALTREEALKGMTIWAAKANFEENEKGSIENGKFADIVILEQDLMTANPKDLFHINVLMTILNGDIVYKK